MQVITSRVRNLNNILLAFFLLTFAAGSIAFYYSQRPSSVELISDRIEANLSFQVSELDREAEDVKRSIEHEPDELIGKEKTFSWYYYTSRSLLKWSDNSFVPPLSAVSDTFHVKRIRWGYSDYLAKRYDIGRNRFLIGVIPLIRRYSITNNYLQPRWNDKIFPSDEINITDANSSVGQPICVRDRCVFNVSIPRNNISVHSKTQRAALIFLSLAIVTLVILVARYVRQIKNKEIGLVAFFLFLLGLRLVMIIVGFPALIVHNDLFNPEIFASSALNRSLGDLLLNLTALLVLCFYWFNHYTQFRIIRWMRRNQMSAQVLALMASLLLFFSFQFPSTVIQTLYANSGFELDISKSLDFDLLKIVCFICIVLSATCSFLVIHPCIRLLLSIRPVRVLVATLLASIIFIGVYFYSGEPFLPAWSTGIGFIIVVTILRLPKSLKKLGFTTFSYLFVSLFFYAVLIAFSINNFSHKEKIERQFRFASAFLIERDYFAEYLLREFSQKISRDAFIQGRMVNPFFSKDAVRQKIRQVYLPKYFDKYDVEIYLFNGAGEAIENRIPISFTTFLSQFDNEAYRTEYEGLYYISRPNGEVSQQYIVKIPIRKGSLFAGFIVIELRLKKIIPDYVYPELLVDNRFQATYRVPDLNYAVFVNQDLLYSSGAINYGHLVSEGILGNPGLYKKGLVINGYDHIALEDEAGRIAIVSSPRTSLTLLLANFSFQLVLGLAVILLFILVQGWNTYMKGAKLFFSARIQLLLNIAFLLPLVIVSLVTLRVTSTSSRSQINEEYRQKARIFSDQISSQLYTFLTSRNANIVNFENQLSTLASLTNLDANVYDSRGFLQATSQPHIFENGLISAYINPNALVKIRSGQDVFVEREKVGSLDYFIAYASLRSSSNGNLIGIVGIPFFQSVYSLEAVQISVLANILNIFAVVFMALVVLSYFVSRWLTDPLRIFTQSLKRTSFTNVNRPLVWRSDDEIGIMVREYNTMLRKLSESKEELEQIQRERVWREIAQQIAHEIKNPLTPMKLMLQKLERSLGNGRDNELKAKDTIQSLLGQINTLDEIASSFSSFAKLPEPVLEELDIVNFIRQIVLLHDQGGDVSFHTSHKEIWIRTDQNMIGRSISNIIINASQAVVPGRPFRLNVHITKSVRHVLITIEDNGKGMEEDVAERIFIPHFTTKKSGSGLGLAIARQAIEQMNGRIWFTSKPNVGTVFYIEHPIL